MPSSSLEHLRRQLAEPLAHPDAATLRELSNQTLDWLLHDFTTLPDQAIGRGGGRAEMEALLQEPPPETGQAFAHVLAEFQDKVAAHAFRVNHPRFLAFVPGAPSFVSVLGDLLCAGTNFFAGVWLEAAGPAQVELLVLDWFKEFVGYPATARGIFTGGGSEATLTALLVAREPLSFPDRARAVLYVSEQRHWSVDRAAKLIGFRPDQLRPVAVDAEYRLVPAALAEAVAEDRREGQLPWVLVANAGTTNTGAVDPLVDLAALCREQRLWFHVDAAYGWPMVLVPEGQTMRDGMAQADSLTLDPHKWFAQTFEAGCLLVREGRRLHDTFAMRPEYMCDVEPADDEINFCDHGIALTRRFRALKIWLSVKVLGVGWFRDLVTRCCRLADYAQALLQRSPHFEIFSPRHLSIICFRYVPAGYPARGEKREETIDRLNLAIIAGLMESGRAFLSSTRLRGRVALRFCFVNWRTTAADVEQFVQLLADMGASAAGSGA
jgi:glutamate/tyrosine decarboxylase-like PLP-dependent enzyme